tara:strand:+ start:5527 stop:5688 length:162 start_codon:yes stop_codon:yes gene_type:complete
MTNYDILVDSINQKLYEVYSMGQSLDADDWDDESANSIATNIIEMVEDYKSMV